MKSSIHYRRCIAFHWLQDQNIFFDWLCFIRQIHVFLSNRKLY